MFVIIVFKMASRCSNFGGKKCHPPFFTKSCSKNNLKSISASKFHKSPKSNTVAPTTKFVYLSKSNLKNVRKKSYIVTSTDKNTQTQPHLR